MIPSEYIKTFLPIHELEEIRPVSNKSVAPVSPNDLFLMSQVSVYSSETGNAVTVSKKISYDSLMHKISSDFGITPIKIDVDELSNRISQCSVQIDTVSVALSNAISLCANTLSSYSNELCNSLSTNVDANYIKKYNFECNTVITATPTAGTKLLKTFTVDNGIISINENDYAFLSDLIAAKDWQLASGGIAGDKSKTSTIGLSGYNEYCYEVLSDCYLNCNISAYEDDSYSPLQVWIVTNITENTTSSLYQTLNNPGGFSGKEFCNYYHFTIPIKAFQSSSSTSHISVIIKYEDAINTFKNNSYAVFDEYCFYAVPSKNELSNYVKKLNSPLSDPVQSDTIYQIHYDKYTGQITSATSAYYGKATDKNAGLVKIHNDDVSVPNYALKLDDGDFAYVTLPFASANDVGTIRLNYSNNAHHNTNDNAFLKCGLEADDEHKGQTFIPEATDDKYGVIKLSTNYINFGSWSNESYELTNSISSYAAVDENGHAYVVLPMADGKGIPGLIKTSIADTSELRIVRNVYVDSNGFAQVNVVNQPGVGLFDKGYTKCIEIPLENATSISDLNENVYMFDGSEVECSAYGDYVFSKIQSINGWFMASLVYVGTGSNEYTQNNSYLQIICDNTLATTINISQIQGSIGKKFCYSMPLGVFKGNINNTRRLFAAISNVTKIGPTNNSDSLYFLIKEMNINN